MGITQSKQNYQVKYGNLSEEDYYSVITNTKMHNEKKVCVNDALDLRIMANLVCSNYSPSVIGVTRKYATKRDMRDFIGWKKVQEFDDIYDQQVSCGLALLADQSNQELRTKLAELLKNNVHHAIKPLNSLRNNYNYGCAVFSVIRRYVPIVDSVPDYLATSEIYKDPYGCTTRYEANRNNAIQTSIFDAAQEIKRPSLTDGFMIHYDVERVANPGTEAIYSTICEKSNNIYAIGFNNNIPRKAYNSDKDREIYEKIELIFANIVAGNRVNFQGISKKYKLENAELYESTISKDILDAVR